MKYNKVSIVLSQEIEVLVSDLIIKGDEGRLPLDQVWRHIRFGFKDQTKSDQVLFSGIIHTWLNKHATDYRPWSKDQARTATDTEVAQAWPMAAVTLGEIRSLHAQLGFSPQLYGMAAALLRWGRDALPKDSDLAVEVLLMIVQDLCARRRMEYTPEVMELIPDEVLEREVVRREEARIKNMMEER